MTSSCSSIRELLDDALDSRLAPAARAEFDEHVRSCAACSAELEFATSLRASLLRIGLDPAPAGLSESIAAEVMRASRGAPRSLVYGRVAAGILVLVTVTWLGLRSRETRPAPAATEATPAGRTDAVDKESGFVAKAKARPPAVGAAGPPVQITTGPAGSTWELGAPARPELSDAQELVDLGQERSRLETPGTTPEHRLRQAEFLVLLHANVGPLTEAAGEAPALAQLARDADDTLAVLSDRGGVAKAQAGDLKKAEASNEKDGADSASALKVVPAPPSPARGAGSAPAGGREAAAGEPAFYMVSGPGAIARVQRVLTDRALRSQQVSLADQSENLRKRKLDEEKAGYRIVEVVVPEAGLNDLIGDLESLAGLTLAPVGQGAAAPGKPNQLPNRKLRLVLIDR